MEASRRKLDGAEPPIDGQKSKPPPSSVAESNAAMRKLLDSVPVADFDVAVRSEPVLERWRLQLQYRLRKGVMHPYFSRFFMSCIVANTGKLRTLRMHLPAQFLTACACIFVCADMKAA